MVTVGGKIEQYTVQIKLKEANYASTLGIIDPKNIGCRPEAVGKVPSLLNWKLAIGTGSLHQRN